MRSQILTIPLPGEGSAILNLPQPLTFELLRQSEQALANTLGQLRCEMCDDNAIADPGALEYASWMQALHPARP